MQFSTYNIDVSIGGLATTYAFAGESLGLTRKKLIKLARLGKYDSPELNDVSVNIYK